MKKISIVAAFLVASICFIATTAKAERYFTGKLYYGYPAGIELAHQMCVTEFSGFSAGQERLMFNLNVNQCAGTLVAFGFTGDNKIVVSLYVDNKQAYIVSNDPALGLMNELEGSSTAPATSYNPTPASAAPAAEKKKSFLSKAAPYLLVGALLYVASKNRNDRRNDRRDHRDNGYGHNDSNGPQENPPSSQHGGHDNGGYQHDGYDGPHGHAPAPGSLSNCLGSCMQRYNDSLYCQRSCGI